MIKIRHIQVKMICLLMLTMILTSCGGANSATVTISYTLPIVPITFSFDSNGHISVSVSARIVTELGELAVSVGAPITSYPVPANALLITIRHKEDGNLVDTSYRVNTTGEGSVDVQGNISEVRVGWTGKNNSVFIDASNGDITSIVIQSAGTNASSTAYSNDTPPATTQPNTGVATTPQASVNTAATAQANAAATAQANANATATAQANINTNATATAQANANATATAQSNSGPKILGGLSDLSGYCQSIGDSTASLDGNTAYSWTCVTPGGQHVGMSMTAACQWQYHDPNAEDRMGNYFDPYSWECFTNARELGAAGNLASYCQSIGDSTASLDGNTGYSWTCVTPGGQHVGLSMTAACQWQYHDTHALDRLENYFDPHSWQCWG